MRKKIRCFLYDSLTLDLVQYIMESGITAANKDNNFGLYYALVFYCLQLKLTFFGYIL